MEKQIPVSIVMSLYNTPIKYLKESIESMLNQTHKNFEIVLIDDGASKEEIETVKSYQDDRIKIYHNECNMGLEKSLNKGIEFAKYDYIIRMDTDDIAYPERIEKQIKFMEEHPEYALVGTRVKLFNETDGIYGETNLHGEIDKNKLLKGPPFIHPSLIIRKDILKKIGGYPLYRRCEDYAMELEMYCNGYKGYIMDDILLKYRVINNYQKRKLKYRIISVKLRMKYFRKLKIKWYQYFYVIKPILTGKVFWMFKQTINKLKNKL